MAKKVMFESDVLSVTLTRAMPSACATPPLGAACTIVVGGARECTTAGGRCQADWCECVCVYVGGGISCASFKPVAHLPISHA